MNPAAPYAMQHIYASTYCQHDQHTDCRLRCKVCGAACACWCHGSERET